MRACVSHALNPEKLFKIVLKFTVLAHKIRIEESLQSLRYVFYLVTSK